MKKYARLSRRILRNLHSVWVRANGDDKTEGLLWYLDAHTTASTIAARYGVTVSQACGVIAALSPGSNWGTNIQDADRLIAAYVLEVKLPVVGTYGRRNVEKARKILQGAAPLTVLGGFKVRAFYSNLLDPTVAGSVTIDRHAKAAAFGRTDSDAKVVKDSEYAFLARHFVKLANDQGILPHQYQAVCWVTWRRLRGQLDQQDIPF